LRVERPILSGVEIGFQALGRQLPFDPKLAFELRLRVSGDHGEEENTFPDTSADFPVPFVAVFEPPPASA
jgi:hypothetical protein